MRNAVAPVAPPASCRAILKVGVRGGLNNQKECLINAGIVAHALNITLAVPHLDVVGHGNEKFEPANANYVKPYADRSRRGHFGHFYNTSWFLENLRSDMSLITRVKLIFGSGRPPNMVQLPSVANVSNGCEGFTRWQDTCEATDWDKRLLDILLDRWRSFIGGRCRRNGGGGPILFDAGRSLCWNVYKSRHATSCVKHYPFCGRMLRALRWNSVISRLQQRVLLGIARMRANASGVRREAAAVDDRAGWSASGWVGVHVRAFVCARNKRQPTFDHVVSALSKLGVVRGLLYVVSSVPVAQVQAALPQFTVIAKSSFLGDDVRLMYPFEVLAAIDYGVAVAAPLYLGEPMMSSFDAFAEEDRLQQNRTTGTIPGACGAGAGPGA